MGFYAPPEKKIYTQDELIKITRDLNAKLRQLTPEQQREVELTGVIPVIAPQTEKKSGFVG